MTSRPGTARLIGTACGLSEKTGIAISPSHAMHISDGLTTIRLGANGLLMIKDLLDDVNSDQNLQISASLTELGSLRLEATGCNPVIVDGTVTNPELAQLGLVVGASPAGSLSEVRSMYARQFDFLASKIDLLVSDASSDCPNLLDGENLEVDFGGIPTRRITIRGANFRCRSLGIAGSTSSFQTDEEVQRVLSVLGAGLSRMRTQSIAFASRADTLSTQLALVNAPQRRHIHHFDNLCRVLSPL